MLNLYDVFSKWENMSNVYECYFKSTAFSTLKSYTKDIELEEKDIKEHNIKEIDKLAKLGLFSQSGELYIIDLDSSKGIDYALLLNNSLQIKPILAYNHIFHKYGIVGDIELANRIISYADKLEDNKDIAKYAFILDYNRYIDDVDLTNPLLYNNQYEVTEEDLPYAELLKEQQIKTIVYITEDKVKEDIKDYFEYLKTEDINIRIVRLKEGMYK